MRFTPYHYHGHIPSGTDLSLEQDMTNGPNLMDPDCQQVPIFEAGYNMNYQSSEECRALKAARQATPMEPHVVTPLTIDAQGNTWWAEQATLRHSVNGTATHLDLPSPVNAFAADPVRGVWLGTDQGLAYTDGTELHWLALTPEGYTIAAEPADLAIDPQGHVWMLTVTGQIAWLQPDRSPEFKILGTSAVGATSAVHAMAASPGGGLWIAYDTDLGRVEPDESPSAPLVHPFAGYRLERLTVDPSGNVWAIINSYDQSVFVLQYQLDKGRWIGHNSMLNLSHYSAKVVASPNGAVYVFDEHGFSQLTEAGGAITGTQQPTADRAEDVYSHPALFTLPIANTSRIHDAGVDRQGRIWILTGTIDTRLQLWRYVQGQATEVELPLDNSQIALLHIAPDDRLWVSDNRHLAVYDGKTWRITGLPNIGTLNRITTAPDGRVWIAGDRGVAAYDSKLDK